jgi:transposase, IS6 family
VCQVPVTDPVIAHLIRRCLRWNRRRSARGQALGVVRSIRRVTVTRSEFAGSAYPPDVITLTVHWYLRSAVLPRDVEEPLADRGIEADHATVFRWVVRFTPLFAEAAPPCRHNSGDRWFVDETQVKVLGRWRYLYRAVDQFGQVMDVPVSPNGTRKQPGGPHPGAGRRHLAGRGDHRPGRRLLGVLDELLPAAQHFTVP